MIYEVNTAVWLAGRRLDEVSWESVALPGVEAVWLMGVWERSPAGLAIARNDPGLEAGNRAALPDLRDADVIGSPYCVRDYVVDARFGGPAALAAARAALAELGLKLILDYVPNHVAPDHPWAASRPELLVPGDPGDPVGSVEVGAGWVARGRDPYFPPWPDVVQLNAFAPALREAVGDTLLDLAGQCDGLRCDMAMLMCNEIFARTWGGEPPDEEYWPPLIARVKAAYPEFLFIAEAYWDMEWTLQQQGFDFAYDKRLYDRLVSGSAAEVRGHLSADAAYQDKLLRFIENHDEPRAASVFGPEQARAAAVVATTLRGARLVHDGQLDGLRTRIPVFLARGPSEPADAGLRAFYERLLPAVAGPREGWALCDVTGWPDNDSSERLVAYCWRDHLVVVNLSDGAAQGRVRLPWPGLAGRSWRLTDALSGAVFERAGDELAGEGLYVDVPGWGVHLLALSDLPPGERPGSRH